MVRFDWQLTRLKTRHVYRISKEGPQIFLYSNDCVADKDSNPQYNSNLPWIAVLCRMTVIAKCDQVFLRVVARVASKFLVVDFEVGHRSAELTAPAVSP
jgi:hypothetical protein